MILILSYYSKTSFYGEKIFSTCCVSCWINNNENDYLASEIFKNDLYFLKVQILNEYYEDLFEDGLDIIKNKKDIEEQFNNLFEYSYWVFPR